MQEQTLYMNKNPCLTISHPNNKISTQIKFYGPDLLSHIKLYIIPKIKRNLKIYI